MDANTISLHARQRAVSGRKEREQAARARRPFFQRLFRRKEVTTFHRCLAVHMHFAQRRGLMS